MIKIQLTNHSAACWWRGFDLESSARGGLGGCKKEDVMCARKPNCGVMWRESKVY